MKKLLRYVLFFVILAGFVYLGYFAYRKYAGPKDRTVFRTEKIEKTDLIRSITATGTVEPEELVNVGAQVQGMITQFGIDRDGKTVDYGSYVTAGSVLARIDDALYAADVKSAKAAKLQAEAAITTAKANILQAEAKLELAKLNMNRAKQLLPTNAIAKSTYDSELADYHVALANQASANASLEQANAQLASANAALEREERDLSYCVIRSPVDGVIIDRRVNIGQTVVSSMSAPSLFLIAKDLRKMQVWVSVNEADVGQIKVGQDVIFTVDAFQNREFKGKVHKVRLNATMSSNVVTYVVEVETDNSDGVLLPYLTANVKFILARRSDVLAVANAALRFTPEASAAVRQDVISKARNARKEKERTVWMVENEMLRPVIVQTGLNDGTMTEIQSDQLKEGMTVVTGTEVLSSSAQASAAPSKSPFLPTPPRRSSSGGRAR